MIKKAVVTLALLSTPARTTAVEMRPLSAWQANPPSDAHAGATTDRRRLAEALEGT